MENQTLVLNAKQIEQRLHRLAWQVYEACNDEQEIILAGIAKNGSVLAQRIQQLVESISPLKIKLVELKFDKDNPLQTPPVLHLTAEELRDKTVIVIDDVSNSGRTLMYGVKPFLEFPIRSVLTLVLVDRDHNRYPVKTNFVGLSLATTMLEHIRVEFSEQGEHAVYLD
jgi:pyrimidine operon attenuation protein / uracil phosphoribosyltransferase